MFYKRTPLLLMVAKYSGNDMGSLTKTKALFGTTSPRTLEKVIPEIELLTSSFGGQKWSGNQPLQVSFFDTLFNSDFYEGSSYPSAPALAARDRITRAPKALGFIDLKPIIKLTEIGKVLLTRNRIDETFTRQLLKFQLPSPYHTQSKKVEFKVKPYLELIRLINDLESISKTEIALFFSQLINIDKYPFIIKKIKDFRANAKIFKGSRKMYVSQCFEEEVLDIYSEEVKEGNLKTRQSRDDSLKKFIKTKSANMKDYSDAFSRYIRATGLISFQRRTFRLIVSPQKTEEVNYILSNIERVPTKFKSESEFKEYLFSPISLKLFSDDKDLIIDKLKSLGETSIDTSLDIETLKDLLQLLQEQIKADNIKEREKELKDRNELPQIIETFEKIKKKDIPDPPLFLEWNVWRAMVMLNYAKSVEGNFIMDIDGMPLNYAPGMKPDIEVEYDDFGLIVEVTMSSGNTQYNMEGEPVPRHFGKAKEALGKEMYCIFIAPKISEGTLAHYFSLNKMNTKLYGGKTKIIPLSIEQFIEFISAGIKDKFNDSIKLQCWLEQQWQSNQSCDDEDVWAETIKSSISEWAA